MAEVVSLVRRSSNLQIAFRSRDAENFYCWPMAEVCGMCDQSGTKEGRLAELVWIGK
jgi:hypothetical protein